MPISQTECYFENLWYHFLEKPKLFLLPLKWNLSEKAFSSVKTKTKPNVAVKPAEQPFFFTDYLMNHIFQTFVFLLRVIECIKLNWLCKHMKKVRRSKAAILVLNWVNCTELLNFFLWVSLKTLCDEDFVLIHYSSYRKQR